MPCSRTEHGLTRVGLEPQALCYLIVWMQYGSQGFAHISGTFFTKCIYGNLKKTQGCHKMQTQVVFWFTNGPILCLPHAT